MKLSDAFQIKKYIFATPDPDWTIKRDLSKLPKPVWKSLGVRLLNRKSALARYLGFIKLAKKRIGAIKAEPLKATEAEDRADEKQKRNHYLGDLIADVKCWKTDREYIKTNKSSNYFFIFNGGSAKYAGVYTSKPFEIVVSANTKLIDRIAEKLTMLVEANQISGYHDLHTLSWILSEQRKDAIKGLKAHADPEVLFKRDELAFLTAHMITRKYFLPLAKDELDEDKDGMAHGDDEAKERYQTVKNCINADRAGFYHIPPIGPGDLGAAVSGLALCTLDLHIKSTEQVIRDVNGAVKDALPMDIEDQMETLDYADQTVNTKLPIDFRTRWTGNYGNDALDVNSWHGTSKSFEEDKLRSKIAQKVWDEETEPSK